MSQIALLKSPDLIIVGAGLAGLLTAWRCLETRAAQNVLILEQKDDYAGNQTWSFHRTDLSAESFEWLRPMVAHNWLAYSVRFPAYERELSLEYCSSNSASLKGAISSLIERGALQIRLNVQTERIERARVILTNGEILAAPAVIDATGFTPSPHRILGYQKFVGHVVRTEKPHGLKHPIIMDATVPQRDGYRFVYCLPYSLDELLIEDTYYEDDASLSENLIAARIDDYAKSQGWTIAETLGREKGVLPITLASDIESQLAAEDGAPRIGLAGGLYHAVTGYSFANAVRTAMAIGDLPKLTPETLSAAIEKERRGHASRERFFRLLNRMLFRAGKPEKRYAVLQRFYNLSEPLVEKFYAGELTIFQKSRLLIGKPPVPIGGALYNLSERSFVKRNRKTP